MPMQHIIPRLRIAMLTDMADEETLSERLMHLVGLEEDHFLVGFH